MSIDQPALRPTIPRHASRLITALSLVQSTEVYPPHQSPSDLPQPTTSSDAHDVPVLGIEHVPVDDDPREWSEIKKNLVLTMMTIAVVCFCCFLESTYSEAEHSLDRQ